MTAEEEGREELRGAGDDGRGWEESEGERDGEGSEVARLFTAVTGGDFGMGLLRTREGTEERGIEGEDMVVSEGRVLV